MMPMAEDLGTLVARLAAHRVGLNRLLMTSESVLEPSDRPLVMFLHGAFHGGWCYAFYLEACAEAGIPAVAVDMRGHGGLPLEDLSPGDGMMDMAGDIVHVCQQLSRPIVIAGHSLGGGVAGIVASRYPTVGTILLAPTPPAGVDTRKNLPVFAETRLVPPPPLEEARKRFFVNHSASEANALASWLSAESPTWLNDRRNQQVPVERHRVSGPALCLAADLDDQSLHPPGLDYATARFFDAEYHFLSGAGHCFMLEDHWRASASLITHWYRRNFLAGRPSVPEKELVSPTGPPPLTRSR